jgi:uncharacterized protein DUF6624
MKKIEAGPVRISRLYVTTFLIVATLTGTAFAEEKPCAGSLAPKGAWVEKGGTAQFLFEEERVVVRQGGQLRAASILGRGPCTLLVRDQGIRVNWSLSGEDHTLRLDQGKGPLTLVELSASPPELNINPYPLPPLKPIPPARVKEISEELTSRSRRDQEAYSKQEERSARAGILADNGRYLRQVVGQYGWIDIPRFGKAAAAAAILIVKHADDVPLMQAALPIVEVDARENGGGKELVSILVDEVLITTGHKQKYGTQITEDASGKPYVVPVEDPDRVDEYRKTLGIPSWPEYLKRASTALYAGAPIRLPGPDE